MAHHFKKRYGGLAQLGERLPCKQEVSGSIPLISTKRLIEVPRKRCFTEFLEKEIQRCTLKTEHCYYDAIMRRQHKGKFIIQKKLGKNTILAI